MNDTVDRDKSTPLARSFQDHEIIAIPFEGELYVILAQLERAWAYAPKGLSKQLARWESRGQVREGTHYRKLTNGKLSAFKEAIGDQFANCELDPKASHVLVVTERGLYRLLTLIPDKAIALAFQDWLEAEVLPAINRTGRYEAASAVTSTPPLTLPPLAPAATLEELRYRVEGLERIASTGQLDRATASALLAQAAALLVAGPGGRGDGGGGPQLPAVAMSGGEADAEHPGLVPLAWAARPQVLMGRNQRPVPGLPAELEGQSPQDLMVFFVNAHHVLSDRAWRFFARWVVEAGILHAPRWMEVLNAASKDPRPAEEPRRRVRKPAVTARPA